MIEFAYRLNQWLRDKIQSTSGKQSGSGKEKHSESGKEKQTEAQKKRGWRQHIR